MRDSAEQQDEEEHDLDGDDHEGDEARSVVTHAFPSTMDFTRCQWGGLAIALIKLDEALELGLVDPAMYGRGSAARAFPGNFGSNAPFWRLPRFMRTGIYGGPRFGLGPLGLGLGLSPQPSALAGPGSVPVGRRLGVPVRPRTREEELAAMAALEAAGALPGQRAFPRRTATPLPRPTITPQAARSVSATPEALANVAQVQKILGISKLASQVLGATGATPEGMGQPEAIEEAFKAQKEGQEADLTQVSPEALALLNLAAMPADVAAALEGLTPETLGAIEILRASRQATPIIQPESLEEVGMTAGGPSDGILQGVTGRDVLAGISGLSGAAQIAAAFIGQGDPARRGLSAAQGLLSAVQATRQFDPQIFSDFINPGALGAVGPVLGLAGAAKGFAEGDIGKGALGLVQTGIQAAANPAITSALGLTALPSTAGAGVGTGFALAAEGGLTAAGAGAASAEAAAAAAAAEGSALIASAGPYVAAAVGAYLIARGLEREGIGGYGIGSVFSGRPRGLITDVFGGFFGLDSGPSKAWLTFPERIAGGIQEYHLLGKELFENLRAAKTQGDVASATDVFRQGVQGGGTRTGGFGGVGGYAQPGYWVGDPYGGDLYGPNGAYRIPPLPDATGSKHEGGISWQSAPFTNELRNAVSTTFNFLPPGGATRSPTSLYQNYQTGLEQARAAEAASRASFRSEQLSQSQYSPEEIGRYTPEAGYTFYPASQDESAMLQDREGNRVWPAATNYNAGGS